MAFSDSAMHIHRNFSVPVLLLYLSAEDMAKGVFHGFSSSEKERSLRSSYELTAFGFFEVVAQLRLGNGKRNLKH